MYHRIIQVIYLYSSSLKIKTPGFQTCFVLQFEQKLGCLCVINRYSLDNMLKMSTDLISVLKIMWISLLICVCFPDRNIGFSLLGGHKSLKNLEWPNCITCTWVSLTQECLYILKASIIISESVTQVYEIVIYKEADKFTLKS